jgi:hypothetical protein
VTYEIRVNNTGDADQPNNPGHEFTDEIPQFMTYVAGSASATSGVIGVDNNQIFWDGKIESGKTVTIKFKARVNEDTPNNTIICNQGVVHWDSTGDGNNDTREVTDNPSTKEDDDATCLTVTKHPPVIEAEKIVIGESGSSFSPGDVVLYKISVFNLGSGSQEDNSGHEFVDKISDFMEYVPGSLIASHGTAKIEGKQVVWDGELLAGAVVKIAFKASISNDVQEQQVICNQGHVYWDSDSNGENDADEPTDDPSTAQDDDPTCFTITMIDEMAMVGTIDAPTLSQWAQITMSVLLALAFVTMIIKRRMASDAK